MAAFAVSCTSVVGLGAQLRARRTPARASAARAPLPRQTGVVTVAKADSPFAQKAAGLMLAGAMLFSPLVITEDAMAAQGGGRMGGRSGFSSRTQARQAPAARQQAPATNTVIVQQPVMASPFGFSPFGFSPFGFSPFGFSPFGFGFGFGGGGFIIQLMLGLFILQVVLGFVGNMMSGGRDDDYQSNNFDDFSDKKANKKDSFDDFK